jgi:hypothetical protein
MPETPSPENRLGGEGLALGIAAFAMIGCCGLPLLIVLASSVAIGTLLGVGVGLLALVGLALLVLLRVRRRAACEAPRERSGSAGPKQPAEREVV